MVNYIKFQSLLMEEAIIFHFCQLSTKFIVNSLQITRGVAITGLNWEQW